MSDSLVPIQFNRQDLVAKPITQIRIPYAKVKYGVYFEFPNDPEFGKNGRLDSIKAGVIMWRGPIRRNYLSRYDQNATAGKPDCWSVDGINGARDQEIRSYNGKKYYTFGQCNECLYSKFSSANIWQQSEDFNPNNVQPGKGQQCSQYALAFLLMDMSPFGEGGRVIALQIPPTGVLVYDIIMDKEARASNSIPEAFLWEFLPSGGGPKKDYMTVSKVSPLAQDGYNKLQDLQKKLLPLIVSMTDRFCGGEDLSSTEVKTVEPSSI